MTTQIKIQNLLNETVTSLLNKTNFLSKEEQLATKIINTSEEILVSFIEDQGDLLFDPSIIKKLTDIYHEDDSGFVTGIKEICLEAIEKISRLLINDIENPNSANNLIRILNHLPFNSDLAPEIFCLIYKNRYKLNTNDLIEFNAAWQENQKHQNFKNKTQEIDTQKIEQLLNEKFDGINNAPSENIDSNNTNNSNYILPPEQTHASAEEIYKKKLTQITDEKLDDTNKAPPGYSDAYYGNGSNYSLEQSYTYAQEIYKNSLTQTADEKFNSINNSYYANNSNYIQLPEQSHEQEKKSDEILNNTNNAPLEHIGLDYVNNPNYTLPSKKSDEQKIGSQRGPYIFLGRKESYIGGVEPGFVGCLTDDIESFKKAVLDIIDKEIKKHNPHAIKRQKEFDQISPEDKIEFFLKEKGECRKLILRKLVASGFKIEITKLDFIDGRFVTISSEAANNTGLVKNLGPFKPVVSGGYQALRTRLYETQSKNAVKEALATNLARNILPREHVQTANILKRTNMISPNESKTAYVLAVGFNPHLNDFGKEFFVAPEKILHGQRIAINKNGDPIKTNDLYTAVETKGLGRTAALQIVFDNDDAYGSSGKNAGYDTKGYFLFDIGHALASDENTLLSNCNTYLLTTGKNFSLLENTTLTDRVEGLLLLHRACTNTILPEAIIASYDKEFVTAYNNVVPTNKIFAAYQQYFKEYDPEFLTTSNNASSINKVLLKAYQQLFKEEDDKSIIDTMEKRWQNNTNKLLSIVGHYLNSTKEEIQAIDALAKLTSDVSNVSPCGKILLGHLRFTNNCPTIWKKIDTVDEGKISFVVGQKLNSHASKITQDYINDFSKQLDINFTITTQNELFTLTIDKKDLKYFTEANVAVFKNFKLSKHKGTKQSDHTNILNGLNLHAIEKEAPEKNDDLDESTFHWVENWKPLFNEHSHAITNEIKKQNTNAVVNNITNAPK